MSILHVDMDAFFVSVELLDHPELRGHPVVVGGTGNRGVVAAASYEARSYGVHSAMPSVTARRLCPQATFLPGRHSRYGEVSRQVMAIFADVTPAVEPLSLDEAFLDVSGAVRLLGPPTQIAALIRRRVLEEEGINCSVGVAPNKFLAKLASQRAKPTASPQGPVPGPGVLEITPDGILAFLHPLDVSALWGVGPATLEKLRRLGISTVGDLSRLPVESLVAALGNASGRHLHRLSHGLDDRPVVTDLAPKSVSHEETFATDLYSLEEIHPELVRMADSVGARLRNNGLSGRTVGLKIRYSDGFRTLTRSTTLQDPTDDGHVILETARRMLEQLDVTPGVRLVGVGMSNLDTGAARQLTLDEVEVEGDAGRDKANQAVDEIRRRFGARSIGPATLVDHAGVRTFEVGQQQWGPDAPGP